MSIRDLTIAGVIFGGISLVWLLVRDGWAGLAHPRAVSRAARLPLETGKYTLGWRASSWSDRMLRDAYRFQLLISLGCLLAAGVWWLVAGAH